MTSPQRVGAVEIAHEILQAVARENDDVTLAALSRSLGMTPTRVLRHLSTLVELRLIERDKVTATYRLGIGLIELGERAAVQHTVTRVAYPILQELNRCHGQATYLARAEGGDLAVWLSFRSTDVPHMTMPPGMVFNLDGSASGRVLLAFGGAALTPGRQMSKTRGPQNPDPLSSVAELNERLSIVRKRFYEGFGLESKEARVTYSLAAPVLDHSERAVAAIGLAGFALAAKDRKAELIAALLKTAQEISRSLGSHTRWPIPDTRSIGS